MSMTADGGGLLVILHWMILLDKLYFLNYFSIFSTVPKERVPEDWVIENEVVDPQWVFIFLEIELN